MMLNEITIEVTQQCPNRCIYCSSFSDLKKKECLDIDTIKKVISDARSLGAKSVSISGGEPFLRPDIVEIAEYIQMQGLKVLIYSSGIFYKDGEFQSIPSSLIQAIKGKIDKLIFNYETTDAGLYANVMGTQPNNLSLLEVSIENAINLGVHVEAHIVPMHCNYKEIPTTLNRLYSLGVSNVSLLRLVPQGRVIENRKHVELNLEEEKELRQVMAQCKQQYEGKLRLGVPFSSKRTACGTGIKKLTIRYDGFVFPCEAYKDGMMEIEQGIVPENVRDRRLVDIYNTSAYLKKVREGQNIFKCEKDNEFCYGQFCRRKTLGSNA